MKNFFKDFKLHTFLTVPFASPSIQDTSMVDSECIHLQWSPISSNDVNGILMGYQINATLNGTLVSFLHNSLNHSNVFPSDSICF